MRISELVAILKKIEAERGDLWIEDETGLLLETSSVYLNRDAQGWPVAVYIGSDPSPDAEAVRP